MPDDTPACPGGNGTTGPTLACLVSSLLLGFGLGPARADLVLAGAGNTPLIQLPLKERENRWYSKASVRAGPISMRAIEEAYRSHGIDLGEILAAQRLEIPRLGFAMVPGDLNEAMTVERRKEVFIGLVLPAALAVNEALLAERARLQAAAWQYGFSVDEAPWLRSLGDSYGCDADPVALLERVDVIPLPIVLAQAALESGWGRSRFARLGNALFGKRTSAARRGIRATATSERIFIERFSHVLDSVASHAFILNSGAKFREFRKRRAEMRKQGIALDSHELVETLTGYSERGSAYVKDLQAVIAGLAGLSEARFADQVAEELAIAMAVPGSGLAGPLWPGLTPETATMSLGSGMLRGQRWPSHLPPGASITMAEGSESLP